MKIKIFSTILLFLITFQLFTAFTAVSGSQKLKNEAISISYANETDELLPNNFKLTRKIVEQKIEFKLIYENCSIQFEKGNSSFYYYNQILPRYLFVNKINSSFFTVYFSTAV